MTCPVRALGPAALRLGDAHVRRAVAAIAVAAGNVSDEAVAVAMVAEATRLGPLKVAVNNAGSDGKAAPTADVTTEDWRRVLDVNLDAVFFGMRAQIPAMIAAGGGQS